MPQDSDLEELFFFSVYTTDTRRRSRDIFPNRIKTKPVKVFGGFLWKGCAGKFTRRIMLLPWSLWWQVFVLITITYTYFILFTPHVDYNIYYHIMSYFIEFVFIFDVTIYLLHAFWSILRLHVRVYRRNPVLLTFDVLSLLPLRLIGLHMNGYPKDEINAFGRLFVMFRIYRLVVLIRNFNDIMHSSRKIVYIVEHLVSVCLMLHAASCLWYGCHDSVQDSGSWHGVGYPGIKAISIQFDTYLNCWYYCACRFHCVVFGDSYPYSPSEILLTIALMLIGCVVFKYRIIGLLAFEYVRENSRHLAFVDQYCHMIKFLKFRDAPQWLVEEAKAYKLALWHMKDGVQTSRHLRQLPPTLQMELIFDINVGYFHNSLLFQDTDESFMRQIAVHMRHELYLSGQHVWSQGVVKGGMLCIKRGVLEMLSDEDDESPMIAFTQGTVLGELSLFYSIPAKVTVKAATYVELQVLKRTDFMRAMSEQPLVLEAIRSKIRTRIKVSKQREEAIARYDSGDSRLIRTRYRPMKVLKDHLAGVETEDPTFVDDSHLFYRDHNNERKPKFISDYLKLYKLSENVSTMYSPKICWRATFPWILEPNTDFTRMCDAIHFVTALYLSIVVPYTVILASRTNAVLSVLNNVCMTSLLLNIYIQLTTAIVIKNEKKVSVRDIAREKMSTMGFYLDMVSVFPVSVFVRAFDLRDETPARQAAELVSVLQLWHVWDYMAKWETSFTANTKCLCLAKFFLLISILCYWTGCFMYLYACPSKICRKGTWMTDLVYWETKVFQTMYAKHEKITLTTLLFGTGILTGSGSSGISPGQQDILIVAFLIIIGTYIKSFYIAKICSLYKLSTHRKLQFKESMRELFYFLSANSVSSKIKKRVGKFFAVQWYYNQAVSVNELLKDMSASIQQEVLSIEMVDTLQMCPLFQDCSRDFLQTVAAKTRTMVLPDNEVVQRTGDIGRDLYILQKGHCNVIDHLGKVVASISGGHHFGTIEMFFGLPKVYTVLTTTNCILLNLDYSLIMQCYSTFPDISYPITMVLQDPILLQNASKFEVIKVINSRIDTKINRIAQELKESFVLSNKVNEKVYNKAFESLGILRYVKFLIFPVVVTPHGIFLKLWCTLRFVYAIYYIVIGPYNIATSNYKFNDGYYWSDIGLYLDILVMGHVAYYDKRNILITHPLYTLKHYWRNGFILDVLTVFPFELVLRIFSPDINIDVCRINRLLQLTRVISVFTYWESNIMQVHQIVVLLKFIPVVLTIVNVATAYLFFRACRPYWADGTFLVNCFRSMIVANDTCPLYIPPNPTSPLQIEFNVEESNPISEYMHTFFWAFSMFIGSGCLSISPTTNSDMIVVMVLQIVGLLYFAFMFGYVACSRSTTSNALLEHVEKTKDLANFLFQENVDPMLTLKTIKYFEYIWKRTNGSNPQEICRRLNSALMEDTLVFMYEKTLREVPLFGKVDRSFIRVITQHLHEMYFLKGETVVQCRDVQPYIYIIYRGKVDVLSSYNEMITCMGPGGMFGNFTGQPISCAEVSVCASRSLDLLIIPSQIFFNLVKYYPKIQEPLYKAFERSKDYILPINMDVDDDYKSSDDESDVASNVSFTDSRSGSSRSEIAGTISMASSHSSINRSDSRSQTASTLTGQSARSTYHFRPGTRIYQIFGYMSCVMATSSYCVNLYCLVTLNDCAVLVWLQALMDIFFFVRLYLVLHQSYSNKYGDITIDPAKCRRRYYKNKLRFWTDVIVNFPLEPFAIFFSEPMGAMHYLRLLKLGRLKYLVEFYHETAAELTNNHITIQTVMTAFTIVILVHTLTCIWLVVMIAIYPYKIFNAVKFYRSNKYNSVGQETWNYISALYIISAELTTTGYDEYVIQGNLLMLIMCVCKISGTLLAAVCIGTAMQVAYATKHALTKYETSTRKLIDVLKNQGLSNYQLKKFWKYITQLWITERGRQLPALLQETPYVRRCDLMSAMFGQYLRSSYLFCDTGEPFLRQLAAVMKYTIFFPGNYIVVEGDSEACMYWVISGTVSVVSVRADLTETSHEQLAHGDVFGIMQGINKGVAHCFSYRAQTKVSVVSLSLDSWIGILPFFPEAKKSVNEKAEKLYSLL